MATVLVVDQDPLHLELIGFLLRQNSHSVLTCMEPEKAFEMLRTRVIDLVTMEPARGRDDGLRLCQQLRQLNPGVPLIIVSRQDEEELVVRGLISAADDYITKPFSPRIFLARVQALLRRAGLSRSVATHDDRIVIGELVLDQQRMIAVVHGLRVPLTPRELSMLRALMENAGRVLSRDQLIEVAWGEGFVATNKAVDVYVLRLRQKLQPLLGALPLIRAHRGFGYSLELSAAQQGDPLTELPALDVPQPATRAS